MIREIVEPKEEIYTIHIPKEYLHKRVEILVLPMDEEQTEEDIQKTEIITATSGILSTHSIDPVKWQQEMRNEWNERV